MTLDASSVAIRLSPESPVVEEVPVAAGSVVAVANARLSRHPLSTLDITYVDPSPEFPAIDELEQLWLELVRPPAPRDML